MLHRSVILASILLCCSCSSGSVPECNAGADCASGACGADGRCLSIPDVGADSRADTVETSADAIGHDGDAIDAAPLDGKVGCTPNADDVVSADEIPLAAGLKATFRIATNTAVATAGTATSGGRFLWDFSGALPGDRDALVETIPPASAWWAAKFPSATYGTGLPTSTDLLGIFEVTGAALLIEGQVSSSDGPSRTELTFGTKVPVLKFPLQPSAAWTTTTTVTGLTNGVGSAYQDTYDQKVDALGEAKTPFGTFRVLRLRTIFTRTVGLVSTVVRTYAFITDCFGPVATITSKPNETQAEFTTAAEVRRLAP